MASNYNNYTDTKPIGPNPGFSQPNIQIMHTPQNQPMPVSGNANARWNSPTQSLQNSYPQSTQPHNIPTDPGYMVPPMKSPTASSNQHWPNSPHTRLVAPQTTLATSMIGRSPIKSPYPPWPVTPPRVIPPHVNVMRTASPSPPSRASPPSWPFTSPRAQPNFTLQPTSTATTNRGMVIGQQVCAINLSS